MTSAKLAKIREAAGVRVASGEADDRLDLLKLAAWLAWSRHRRSPQSSAAPAPTPAAATPGRRSTKSAIVAATGLSPNAIEQYIRKGLPCDFNARGVRMFDVDEVKAWLVTHGAVERKGHNKVGIWAKGGGEASAQPGAEADRAAAAVVIRTADGRTPAQVELELAASRAREAELKIAVREGRLVEAAKVEAEYTRHLSTVRTTMETLPVQATQAVLAKAQLDESLKHVVLEAIAGVVVEAMRTLARDEGEAGGVRDAAG